MLSYLLCSYFISSELLGSQRLMTVSHEDQERFLSSEEYQHIELCLISG